MRTPAPETRPVALTIAGSDSGGGAGIQADLATMTAHDVFGTSAITAVTAQHTRGVESSFALPTDEVAAQIDAVTADFDVAAAKTGMLASSEIVETVADRAEEFSFPLVVDPVMVAATGDRLLEPAAERAYEDLLSEAALVTPNADETEVLTGVEVVDEERAREAGEALLEIGADAALVKGGHVPGETVRDVLVTADGTRTFEHPRIDTDATHGSGCTLAASIASRLARGDDLETAVDGGTAFLERAVRYAHDVGEGPGAVNHAVALRDAAARDRTAESVRTVVDRLVDADVSRLVPEVGLNVVGATPAADSVDDVAAVEGRLTRIGDGVRPNMGVRFGVSGYVARVLLGAREVVPDLRFAASCRFDDEVEAALADLEWTTAEYECSSTDAESDAAAAARDVRRALQGSSETPVALVDRGGIRREATATIVARDAETLAERTVALCERL